MERSCWQKEEEEEEGKYLNDAMADAFFRARKQKKKDVKRGYLFWLKRRDVSHTNWTVPTNATAHTNTTVPTSVTAHTKTTVPTRDGLFHRGA